MSVIKPRARPLGQVSLVRAISKLGIGTRTQAEEWILAGKVKVAGKVVTNPKMWVFPEKAGITVEGVDSSKKRPMTIVLHKPTGLVTTRVDEKGRPTVYSLIEDVKIPLVPVGRLDLATSGLLIMTNDTQLANWITDPKSGVLKTYLVLVDGEFTPEMRLKILAGVTDQGEILKASSVEIRKASRRESHLTVLLNEGKNREIRRMMAAMGTPVRKLKRVAIGTLNLNDLEEGSWRELHPQEITKAFPGAKQGGVSGKKPPGKDHD
ncbi:MAG: rRNA pseudouridine synthase [Bdellovibrionales bacterium]|nr:rRNA pseudouridine synthase [Bdellovibrionales bacterium]